MLYDVIIIGGGAAGLLASIVAKERGQSVLLLERMDKLGKKILATGNGRCNLTNDVMDEDSYRGNRPSFYEAALGKFGQSELLGYFQDLGMLTTQVNGYYYPASLQASTVVDTLSDKIHSLHVDVELSIEVSHIQKVKDIFIIETNTKKRFEGRQVILATGGMAQDKLGSNGSGYHLSKELGHHVTDIYPGLVGLESKDSYFKKIAGVRNVSNLKVFINGREVVKQYGEVQFTKYGISGIPVFQISRYAIEGLRKKKKVEVELNLMPHMLTLEETLEALKKKCSYKNIDQFLNGCLNRKLSECILSRCRIAPMTNVRKIKQEQWKQILDMIQHFKVSISGYKGFDMAQVTVGGVDTTEVINETMESKIHRGLYIVGELLDVDGTCGGYNLQWAFTSGYVAAMQLQ